MSNCVMKNDDRLSNLEDAILVVTENQNTQIDLFKKIIEKLDQTQATKQNISVDYESLAA